MLWSRNDGAVLLSKKTHAGVAAACYLNLINLQRYRVCADRDREEAEVPGSLILLCLHFSSSCCVQSLPPVLRLLISYHIRSLYAK